MLILAVTIRVILIFRLLFLTVRRDSLQADLVPCLKSRRTVGDQAPPFSRAAFRDHSSSYNPLLFPYSLSYYLDNLLKLSRSPSCQFLIVLGLNFRPQLRNFLATKSNPPCPSFSTAPLPGTLHDRHTDRPRRLCPSTLRTVGILQSTAAPSPISVPA